MGYERLRGLSAPASALDSDSSLCNPLVVKMHVLSVGWALWDRRPHRALAEAPCHDRAEDGRDVDLETCLAGGCRGLVTYVLAGHAGWRLQPALLGRDCGRDTDDADAL